MTQSVLILGANGKFGFHAAQAFEAAGWQVHRFDRKRDRLEHAVQGQDVVVNAWNPSDYSKWARELLPMHQKVLDAMQGSGATLLLLGNVYVFGDQTGADWGAETPRKSVNDLGQMRIALEAAYRASNSQCIVLHGGDFLDTRASGNWFDRVMVSGLKRGVLKYPGRIDIPHAWAFLPDIARAAVELSELRHELPAFSDIQFRGYTLSGQDMAGILAKVVGQPVQVKPMSWALFHTLGLVWPMMRGLTKMRYLWDTPHALDGADFDRLVPGFRSTPAQQAFRQAIAHLGLPKPAQTPRVAPAE